MSRRTRVSYSGSLVLLLLSHNIVASFKTDFAPLVETSCKLFDILPHLKEGDSYDAQAASRSTKSFRWVPAAGDMTASLTSQAIRACPALAMLMAATKSALAS